MSPDGKPFWARMYITHQDKLNGFFWRRGVPRWDAQDLAQEVFVRLLRVDSSEDSIIANPEAYLFTVASNLVKEHAVLQKRRGVNVDITLMLPELESPQGTPEAEAEREFYRERLRTVLDRLPPRCKAVMLMQHRDGMSYDEIAAQLGVSSHMVKKYVVKALALCRRGLARYE